MIGSKTKVRRQGIVTGALPSEAAKPLEQTNTAVDGILADGDQIANVSTARSTSQGLYLTNAECFGRVW